MALTPEQAQHCQQGLAWLAANLLFADVFTLQDFLPAASTLAKLTRATEPHKAELVTRFLAEADQAEAALSDLRSQRK